jgi:transcriptional regulator with XRE-family HTH domain
MVSGREVRQIRKRLGLTQRELADLVGVRTNSVARWERNMLGIRESAARLMRVLDEQRAGGGKGADASRRPRAKAVLVRRRTRGADAVEQ